MITKLTVKSGHWGFWKQQLWVARWPKTSHSVVLGCGACGWRPYRITKEKYTWITSVYKHPQNKKYPLLYLSGHQQEGPLIRACSCSRFPPVKRGFFHHHCYCSGVRLCVCEVQTILITTDAIFNKLEWNCVDLCILHWVLRCFLKCVIMFIIWASCLLQSICNFYLCRCWCCCSFLGKSRASLTGLTLFSTRVYEIGGFLMARLRTEK